MKTRYKILSFVILGIAFVSSAFGVTYLFSENPLYGSFNLDSIENLPEVKKFKELYPESQKSMSSSIDTGIADASFTHFEHDTTFVYDGPNKMPNSIVLDIKYDLVTKTLLDAKLRCTFNDKTDIVSKTLVEYLLKENCFESESELDRRQIGWTPAFEYHRVQINGTNASQICSILKIDCPPNPVFDAINRHDKNYTYFYYEFLDMEYLVKIDDGQICYTTDDVLTEETGLFEYCVEVKDHSKSVFEPENELESETSFDYEIKFEGVTYGSQYQITGGIVDEITHDTHSNSLIISLNESDKGHIQIVIQTGVLHSLDQLPFTYFVLVDDEEVVFEQLSPIILKIPFEKGTRQIEIIGTNEI